MANDTMSQTPVPEGIPQGAIKLPNQNVDIEMDAKGAIATWLENNVDLSSGTIMGLATLFLLLTLNVTWWLIAFKVVAWDTISGFFWAYVSVYFGILGFFVSTKIHNVRQETKVKIAEINNHN